MPWVLTKVPESYQGTALNENDLGTIKIALASAATTQLDFWGRTHSDNRAENIYDQALDRVIDMEESESKRAGRWTDDTNQAESRRNSEVVYQDPLSGTSGSRPTGWFGHLINHLFLLL